MKKWEERFFDEEGVIKRPVRIVIFLCIFAILLAESSFLYYHSPKEKTWLICIFYKLTGYYCPGCGAGRACYSILHGQLYQAFRYNPLLCIFLPWFGLYIALCSLQWVMTGRETVNRHIPVWITYIIFAVVIIYGIVRNVGVYPFTLLVPTRLV